MVVVSAMLNEAKRNAQEVLTVIVSVDVGLCLWNMIPLQLSNSGLTGYSDSLD